MKAYVIIAFFVCHLPLIACERDANVKDIGISLDEKHANCFDFAENTLSIYLSKKEIPWNAISKIDIKEIELMNDPIVSGSDIVSYYGTTHLIELTKASYDRILGFRNGTLVFVCLGKRPIYKAVIWDEILSAAYNGTVIMKFRSLGNHYIQIKCGYPNEKYFVGEDPRNNKEIMDFLKKAGKLKK